MKIVVNEYSCPQNHPCPSVNVCPTGAIIQNGYDAPIIDEHKCIKCKKCVYFCPTGAIQIEE